jgi:hypothetical protein
MIRSMPFMACRCVAVGVGHMLLAISCDLTHSCATMTGLDRARNSASVE